MTETHQAEYPPIPPDGGSSHQQAHPCTSGHIARLFLNSGNLEKGEEVLVNEEGCILPTPEDRSEFLAEIFRENFRIMKRRL